MWRDGALLEITPEDIPSRHEIMADLEEFRSPDGARISGRAAWREHLKATGSIEMGHDDMKQVQGRWNQRKQDHAKRIQRDTENVKPAEMPDDPRPAERSRTSVEMANRLAGRPVPDRKTLIKLTLETAKMLARSR